MLTQVPVLDWSANGRAWERSGNRSAYQEAAPQGIYRCAGEDRWIAVTCATEAHWKALADLAGDCLADPRFATMAGRLAHHDALDAARSSWTVGLVRSARADRGVIAQDFAFHGNSAANKLRNFHDHGPGRGANRTTRTKRAGAGPPRR